MILQIIMNLFFAQLPSLWLENNNAPGYRGEDDAGRKNVSMCLFVCDKGSSGSSNHAVHSHL